jgi:hypothetical protein
MILTLLALLMPAFSLPSRPPDLSVELQPLTECSPTATVRRRQLAASVPCLAPLDFRRVAVRLVSYYALFKGWLLLSQPPSCLDNNTSFPTQHGFRDLSWRSWVVSLSSADVITRVLTPAKRSVGIRSLTRVGGEPPSPTSALPPTVFTRG